MDHVPASMQLDELLRLARGLPLLQSIVLESMNDDDWCRYIASLDNHDEDQARTADGPNEQGKDTTNEQRIFAGLLPTLLGT